MPSKEATEISPEYPDTGIPRLYVHDINQSGGASSFLSQNEKIYNGQVMLENLLQLDAKVASHFVIKSMDIGAIKDVPFKLISESRHLSEKSNTFIAVSYCWHYPDWKLADGLMTALPSSSPDWALPIAWRMFQSVLSLRSSEVEGIWIDQICINQNNSVEKAQAVNNMDLVYQSARQVVILLEDVQLSSDEEQVIQVLVGISAHSDAGPVLLSGPDVLKNFRSLDDTQISTTIPTVLRKIFSARWFNRAWCAHEYQLSKNRIFLLSGEDFPVIMIEPGAFRELRYCVDQSSSTGFNYALPGELAAFSKFTCGLESDPNENIDAVHILDTFSFISSLGCVILGDKISIALNVAKVGLLFAGSVSSEEECLWIFASLALSAGDASVLSSVGKRIAVPGGVPRTSWLEWPDPDAVPFAGPRGTYTDQLYISKADLHSINLDQFFLHCELEGILDSSMRRATSFMEAYESCELGLESDLPGPQSQSLLGQKDSSSNDEYEGDYQTADRSPDERRLIITNLACAIQCGASWMVTGVPSKGFYTSLGTGNWHAVDPWPTMCKCLFSDRSNTNEIPVYIEEMKESLVEYIFFALNPYEYLEDLSGLEMYILRFQEGFMKGILCCNLSKEEMSQIMAQSPQNLTWAIPAALANRGAGWMRRAWLLRRRGLATTPSWEIVCKGYLFGIDTLRVNTLGVSLVKNAHVTGSSSRLRG